MIVKLESSLRSSRGLTEARDQPSQDMSSPARDVFPTGEHYWCAKGSPAGFQCPWPPKARVGLKPPVVALPKPGAFLRGDEIVGGGWAGGPCF